jgi:hypothetical protein
MITPILIICSLTVLLFGFDSSADWIQVEHGGAVIRVFDEAGNVIERHEQAVASSGDFWAHR